MKIRALRASDAPELAKFGALPEVVLFGSHFAADPVSVWENWVGDPDPNRGFAIGAFEGDKLLGAMRAMPVLRRRAMHLCQWEWIVSQETSADPIVSALMARALEVCDQWLAVVRCEMRIPSGHSRIDGIFRDHGFVVEGTLEAAIRTKGRFRDLDFLGRIRPNFVAPPPLQTLSMPTRSDRRDGVVTLRDVRKSDAAVLAAMLSEDSVVWGTMQVPFQRAEYWRSLIETQNPRRWRLRGICWNGALAGCISLIQPAHLRRSHVVSLGVQIGTQFQGIGLGRQLVEEAMRLARELGYRRIELAVYTDNVRAQAIYRHLGFSIEATRRWSSYREGTYVNDHIMAFRVR